MEIDLATKLLSAHQNSEPTSEIDCRPIVRDFLRQLNVWEDDYEITFGASLDAVPFEFRSITNIVAINLEQNEEPGWKVKDD